MSKYKKLVSDVVVMEDLLERMTLAVDIFCSCIETGVWPKHGSQCHRLARSLVDEAGFRFERKRRKMPPLKKGTYHT